MVYFIGVEVGVTLNLYTQYTHELCKVNEIPFIQEVRPLTICRNVTSLQLNSWDERQRKKVKFDMRKN